MSGCTVGADVTFRKKLALIGANGMLARKVREQGLVAGYEIVPYDLPEFDVADRVHVLAEMKLLQPDVIVNCAAYTNVDGAETQAELAVKVNGLGPGYLAEASRENGAVLVHVSTDYVFDGHKGRPYLETDPVGPLSAYGRSKLVGEQAILASGAQRYFILRTSWLYGPGGKNFVETIIRLAHEREELRIVVDQIGSPTYTGDLAEAIFQLLAFADHGSWMANPDLYGIYHFANTGQCSWHGFASEIVAQLVRQGKTLSVKQVVPIMTEEYPLPAARPAYSVFSKAKYELATGAEIPEWKTSLARYLREREPTVE